MAAIGKMQVKTGFRGAGPCRAKKESVKGLKDRYLNDPSKSIYQLISFRAAAPYVARDDYATWTHIWLSLWLDAHDCDCEGL